MCSLNQGCSHLQYVITCSMQIQKWKAWEIWSHTMTSGRQMVDIRGLVSDCNNSQFTLISSLVLQNANCIDLAMQTDQVGTAWE